MREKETHPERPVFIFDFGGVVIIWKNNNPIFDYIARRYGIPRAEMRRVFEDSLPRLEAGQVPIGEFLAEALARFGKRLRVGDSPEELWTLPFARGAKLRAGTVKLVKSLKRSGYRVFLFSNTSTPHERFMRKVGWDSFFDGLITSCDIGSLKPSGRAYATVLERIKAAPADVVFVDDKEVNVRGAKEFGIRWAFRFTSVARLRKDLARVESEVGRESPEDHKLGVDVRRIESKVSGVAHGFKEMQEAARMISSERSAAESLEAARELYTSDKYQVRMVAVFVLGYVAARSAEAFRMMRESVVNDSSWQVQEILAMAFNQYCEDVGYGKALPTIKEWLGDHSPNARRAVTEGLRIWNRRDYFSQHPEAAIRMLSDLKDDKSEYVRRSVGNALRDISRSEGELVRRELATWDTSDRSVAFTYSLASRLLQAR